ncbi:MAG: hypothetical protein LC772_00750 [Chloroflexi bacterium]|nr:hypothetical protein [Chloroflexota bacterium]
MLNARSLAGAPAGPGADGIADDGVADDGVADDGIADVGVVPAEAGGDAAGEEADGAVAEAPGEADPDPLPELAGACGGAGSPGSASAAAGPAAATIAGPAATIAAMATDDETERRRPTLRRPVRAFPDGGSFTALDSRQRFSGCSCGSPYSSR